MTVNNLRWDKVKENQKLTIQGLVSKKEYWEKNVGVYIEKIWRFESKKSGGEQN